MKLSDYARLHGVTYRTAWNWFRRGDLPGHQMPSGTIIVDPVLPSTEDVHDAAVIYTRVSNAENRKNLDSQADRVTMYCLARGYQVARVVKEVGSGVNDERPKLLALLRDPSVRLLVVEHRDRLTRFGFVYLETLLGAQGCRIEVVNRASDRENDLMADMAAVLYSFCAELYGSRRGKARADKALTLLDQQDGSDHA
jgi:putative resolvase